MAEYISKEDVIDFLNSKQLSLDGYGATDEATGVLDAKLIIADMKPEDVASVVHSNWEHFKVNGQYKIRCKKCDYIEPEYRTYVRDFCPCCGAKMDKEDN